LAALSGVRRRIISRQRIHRMHACPQAYWPVHRDFCKPNEFADVLDGSEPKFARWMRRHGRLAVLKDGQVERLEQASRGAGPRCGCLQRALAALLAALLLGARRLSGAPAACAARRTGAGRHSGGTLTAPSRARWRRRGAAGGLASRPRARA
jgi:hypothetical protein